MGVIPQSARSLKSPIAMILLALAVPLAGAASDKHSGTEVKGVVTAVDPTHLSLLGDDGRPMSLRTTADFSSQVSVGLEVTLWYTVVNGSGQVESLESAPETFLAPAGLIRERIQKIIILPSSEVPGADGLFEEMRGYLANQFGWYVAPAYLAEEIRERRIQAGAVSAGSKSSSSTLDAINPETGAFDLSRYAQGETGQPKEAAEAKPEAEPQVQPQADPGAGVDGGSTLEAIDPRTGQFDMARYLESRAAQGAPGQPLAGSPRNLMAALADEARVDAVLEASVVSTEAKLDRLVARWDGTEEAIGGKGSQTVAKLSLVAPRGVVPATTVVLKLWDSQGKLLWRDRAGFAVMAAREGIGGKLRERGMAEVLENRADVDKWLKKVFAPLSGSSSLRTDRK